MENMQDHFDFLELDRVWESIGFSLKVLQKWRKDYPVNIAVLDSAVEKTHEAFNNNQVEDPVKHPAKVKSIGGTLGLPVCDRDGHGTFCAGVAAGYPIKSPQEVTESSSFRATRRFCPLISVCQLDTDKKLKTLENVVRQMSGGSISENFPNIVGVAPFANIFSYKIKDKDFEEGLEDQVAHALESIRDTNIKESALKNKVHIVCIAQALCYNGRMRQAIYEVLNQNVIIVAAASNKGQSHDYCNGNIYFPARFGNVITVGSHDELGQPLKLSSVGREVDFLAYGEQIWGPSIEGYKEEEKKEEEEKKKKEAKKMQIMDFLADGEWNQGSSNTIEEEEEKKKEKIETIMDFLAYREWIQGSSIEGYKEEEEKKKEKIVEKDEGTSVSAAIVCGIVALVLAFVHKDKDKGCDEPVVRSKISNNSVMREILGEMVTKSGQHDKIMGYGCLKPFYVFQHKAHILWSLIARVSETYSLVAASAKVSKFILSETSVAMHSSVKNDLYDNTQEALEYLKKRGLTRHVKLINLRLPFSMTEISPSSKVSLFNRVLPIIQKSGVEIIEDLVFPRMEHISCGSDGFFNFIENLPESVRLGLKCVVVPNGITEEDISKIKPILSDSVRLYGEIKPKRFDCQFSDVSFNLREINEGIGQASEVECVDEILKKPLNDKSTQSFCTAKNWHSFPFNDTSLPKSDVQHKVTVAILGDAINIHHNEIKGKINVETHFKCFIDPAEGAVEKDRHLGTVCASIIAGNSEGIAPFVDLVYATVINRNKQTKPEWVIAALEWIEGLPREREHIKVDIVVIPLGFEQFHLGLFQAINRLSAGNTIVVCAASRTHEGVRPQICYPAKYGDVICVGSHSSSSQPSSFSPQGREIDLLALGEDIGFSCFSVSNDSSEIITEKYALSGTCIAVACAAGIIAQMVLFSLQCNYFERHEITNNTVVRELLRNVTCNFSHSPQSGHGWLTNLFESELFKDSSYFTDVLCEILKKPNPSSLDLTEVVFARLKL